MTIATPSFGECDCTSGLRADCGCDARGAAITSAGLKRRLIWIAIAAILIAASFLRFSGLDREGRWGDEYWQTRAYDLPITYPHYVVMAAHEHGQPPLDYLLGWTLAKFARSDWVRRAPSAFFGVVGVALCFLLVRRLTSPVEALIAAALLTVSPLHWTLSQEARPYTICTALLLLVLWTLARALTRPDRRRLLVFAAACYGMVLTRGMLPYVVLLAIGITLTVGLLLRRGEAQTTGSAEFRALRRVWATTVLVGLAAVPVLVFLMYGNGFITFTTAGRQNGALFGAPFLDRLALNASIWTELPIHMFGPSAPVILVLAVAGIVLCVRRRNALSLSARYTLASVAIAPVLYLLTYTAAVSFHPINDRYGLFVVPIVAIFAAIPVAAVVVRFARSAQARPVLAWTAGLAVVILLLASPAASTFGRTRQYFRPDWRGCAEFLEDRVTPEDVIIVFQDRPLGRPQMTFWGKYDWPREMDKPLAEPAWTLASSEPHWQRLAAKTGYPYIVIRYDLEPGLKDDYLNHGLTEAPPGMTLKKFRSLDLLTRSPRDPNHMTGRLIRACDDLIAIPKQHADSNVMLYVLRSRIELLANDPTAAACSLELAKKAKPNRLSQWFDDAVAIHADALADALANSTTTLTSRQPPRSDE